VAFGQTEQPLRDRATKYLTDLVRLDTTNPPGNETRVAEYLKRVADAHGIPAELIGPDRNRLNFVARLKGTGKQKPLLLMAHSDVVPADRSQWSVEPLGAVVKNGIMYGRGTEDVKSLLAAELADHVEMKHRGTTLDRDIILLSESDEEAGSTGMTWMVANAYDKINAEFAINEFAYWQKLPSGATVYQVQTTEKVPTRVKLVGHGTAGHGSLPRSDNPVAHLARAITRLVDADQPVRLNATTKTYFNTMAQLPGYEWLRPMLSKLEDPSASAAVARDIRGRDAEFDAMLHTTVSPTMLTAGVKINVIPNVAEAQVDVRRLPNETREEVLERIQRIIQDDSVSVEDAGGQHMPSTEPSSLTSPLYLAIEKAIRSTDPKAVIVPFLMRGATDGAFLREKGIAVYGVPIFTYEGGSRAHGNDEKIAIKDFQTGTDLLLKIVMEAAGPSTK
jgi:acetylornithine deacetylase/succinyl-diaminopimelate desuccinylase-like protein